MTSVNGHKLTGVGSIALAPLKGLLSSFLKCGGIPLYPVDDLCRHIEALLGRKCDATTVAKVAHLVQDVGTDMMFEIISVIEKAEDKINNTVVTMTPREEDVK